LIDVMLSEHPDLAAAKALFRSAKVVICVTGNNETNPGANPPGSLIGDAKGDLFGTTQNGGARDDGKVFELVKGSSGYTLTTLVSVTGNSETNPGANPAGSQIADAKGGPFGTTQNGGASGHGTAFEITNSGLCRRPKNCWRGREPTNNAIHTDPSISQRSDRRGALVGADGDGHHHPDREGRQRDHQCLFLRCVV
jgi:hypothetical protein